MIQTASKGSLSSYSPVWSRGTSLSHPSPKQIQVRQGDPEKRLTVTKMEMCEPLEEPVASSSTQSMFGAFPGAICSKDGGPLDKGHQHSERSGPGTSDETLVAAKVASHAAEDGSEAVMNFPQFSGMSVCSFEVSTDQCKDPVFLCTTNSMENKMKVVQACSLHKLAAQNLVTICSNDLLSQGAHTLYFMPYFACGKLQSEVAESVLEGLAETCKTLGNTLLERAIVQQSGIHHDGCYSLSGCSVGLTERENQLPRPEQMREGDVVIGIRSAGLHCRSLDLLKKILEKNSLQFTSSVPMSDGDATWGELIMSSSMVYSRSLLQALRSGHIRACIPVTEGGLVGSILRYLPRSIGMVMDALCWRIPLVYSWLYKEGDLSEQDLVDNFSCGLGAVIIAQRTAAQQILADIQQEEEAWLVGGLIKNTSDCPRVRVSHLFEALKVNTFQLLRTVTSKKTYVKISNVSVFISNTGMKLKILIETLRQLSSSAKLVLVISNKSALEELRKAVAAGIPTRVIDHTLFMCQSDFEKTISKVLDQFAVEVICLAGFSRMLSEQFLGKWKGNLLKLHTKYLPSQNGDGVSGKRAGTYSCTVSFLLGGSSSPAPTIVQETVLTESEESVTELIEESEARVVAKALHLLSSGIIHLGADSYIWWRNED